MSDFDYTFKQPGTTWIAQGWRTNDPVVPSQGYGGHPIGARPKRKSLTVYEGRQPFMLKIPMILYRGIPAQNLTTSAGPVFGQPESVEKDRRALEAMAAPPGGGLKQSDRPLPVIVESEFPLPLPPQLGDPSKILWWIEDLDWNGEEMRNSPELTVDPGQLVRKLVTVTLLERVEDELLTKGSGPSRSRKYKVKRGDTLASIAAHQVGGNLAQAIKEIKSLNGIRSDGDLRKKVNHEINLPPAVKASPHKKRKR